VQQVTFIYPPEYSTTTIILPLLQKYQLAAILALPSWRVVSWNKSLMVSLIHHFKENIYVRVLNLVTIQRYHYAKTSKDIKMTGLHVLTIVPSA